MVSGPAPVCVQRSRRSCGSANGSSVFQGCYFCVKQYALECSRIPMGQTVNSQVSAPERKTPAVRLQAWRATVLPGFLTYQVASCLGKSPFLPGEDRKPGWIAALQAWSLTQGPVVSWLGYEDWTADERRNMKEAFVFQSLDKTLNLPGTFPRDLPGRMALACWRFSTRN